MRRPWHKISALICQTGRLALSLILVGVNKVVIRQFVIRSYIGSVFLILEREKAGLYRVEFD